MGKYGLWQGVPRTFCTYEQIKFVQILTCSPCATHKYVLMCTRLYDREISDIK